jgi:hypothetical protein
MRRPPLNDPGATRAITRIADVNGDQQSVPVGVSQHPPGNKRGLDRAPIEPMDRDGRQVVVRHADRRMAQSRSSHDRGVPASRFAAIEHRSSHGPKRDPPSGRKTGGGPSH